MDSDAKWRIMVVDDDPPLLQALLEALRTEFEALGAINGLDALEKMDRFEPDLIVLDVVMPCVDGIDTCRAIRKNARFRKMPVVFMSGYDEATLADRTKGLEAAHFLHKPVVPPQLLECCREVIRRSGIRSPAHKRYSIAELSVSPADSGPPRVGRGKAPGDLAGAEQPAAVGGTPAESGIGQALARVMIVDESREAVGRMLSVLHGRFEVFGVHDPISALYKIIRYQPDVLILNVAMPRMSGYQLSQLLRLNPNLRTIKILFVLTRNRPNEIAYAKKLGAADCLVEPFGAEELLSKVTAITEAPDFIVREKALSLTEIHYAESTDSSASQFA